MAYIFQMVASGLYRLAGILRLTYQEVNVIVYFIAVPLFYASLMDILVGVHYFTVVVAGLVAILVIPTNRFRKRAEALFGYSVSLLQSFHWLGLDYVQASVVVCVVMPIIVLACLLCLM